MCPQHVVGSESRASQKRPRGQAGVSQARVGLRKSARAPKRASRKRVLDGIANYNNSARSWGRWRLRARPSPPGKLAGEARPSLPKRNPGSRVPSPPSKKAPQGGFPRRPPGAVSQVSPQGRSSKAAPQGGSQVGPPKQLPGKAPHGSFPRRPSRVALKRNPPRWFPTEVPQGGCPRRPPRVVFDGGPPGRFQASPPRQFSKEVPCSAN